MATTGFQMMCFRVTLAFQCSRRGFAAHWRKQKFRVLSTYRCRCRGLAETPFSVVNVVERRPALDLSRTDYDVFPEDYFLPERRGKVRGVRRLVLRSEALANCDMARLDEFAPGVYASERFRIVFEQGAFTGCSLREVGCS